MHWRVPARRCPWQTDRLAHPFARLPTVYLPKHFAVEDLAWLDRLAEHDAFATLVSMHEDAPFASHLPVLCRREGESVRVLGHWARPNPQWQTIVGQRVLCMLHGPHTYVSPSFYPVPASRVPTWNYATAHLYGSVRTFDGHDELMALATELADRYERGRERPWSMAEADPALQKLSAGIVGFELTVERIELKFKLNQNHSVENQQGVLAALRASDDPDARQLGEWMGTLMDERVSRRPAG
jgi:transcriptional regulator